MKKVFLFLFFQFGLGILFAQSFSPNLSAGSTLSPNDNVTTIKILAVMADFQTDKDEATTGNGKFGSIYSVDYGQKILDPLPHDINYFQAHLEFVKNYYRKASKGKVLIEYTVLPSIVTVSQTMRSYSPASKSDDFKPLGDFAAEVWHIADSLNPGFNFSDYNTFMVFHAGVGRDISLPGTLGIERDMPSIFMNLASLQKYFKDVSFNGFPVSNNFHIDNTTIIPETESRELSSFNTTYLFQITTNGLLVSSVANKLGLPDLYDTKTGLSAIGRFGLMDGQSIFAYNGLFPPQPSAWEKSFLGWETPLETSLQNMKLSLTASNSFSPNDTSIVKIPINDSEYFLLENRQRDLNKDGAVLKLVVNGDTITKSFAKDTTGFYSYSVDSVYGVLVDIDELDWALPGSGIVIWHIDQNVINSNLSSNTINTNKEHRGVDVVEADGIKEIGEKFTTFTGDIVIGEGSQQDMWYSGNDGHFYKNIFNKDSRPSSNAFDGTLSQITLKNFSVKDNKMSADLSFGDSLAQIVNKLNLGFTPNLITTAFNSSSYYYSINSENNSLNIFTNAGLSKIITNFSDNPDIAVLNSNGINYVLGSIGKRLNIFRQDNSGNYDTTFIELPYGNCLNKMFVQNSSSNNILVSNSNSVYRYSLGNFQSGAPIFIDSVFINRNNLNLNKFASVDDYFAVIGSSQNSVSHFLDNKNVDIEIKDNLAGLLLTKDNLGIVTSIAYSNTDYYIIKNGKIINSFKFISPTANAVSTAILSDIKNDGENYIIYTNDNFLYAQNLQGAVASNYPVKIDSGSYTILSGDFIGDLASEIILVGSNSKIYAFDGITGKIIHGYPFFFNGKIVNQPVITNNGTETEMLAASGNKELYVYRIGMGQGKISWAGNEANPAKNNFVFQAENSKKISNFFPEKRAYNYPNPAYGTSTTIRYYVSEDSKVNVKIFDLAGDLAAELNQDARGGFDNEIVWNIEKIQSGVYLARLNISGNNGKTAETVIKIAIIK